MEHKDLKSIKKYGKLSLNYLVADVQINSCMTKNLIRNGEILEIFIDSKSFDRLLFKNNKSIKNILNYFKSKSFMFIRSPFDTEFRELQIIPEIINDYDEHDNLKSIEILTDSEYSKQSFYYEMDSIVEFGKKLTKKSSLCDYEIESLILAFTHSSLNYNSSNTQILTTDNEFLLKNRSVIELQTELPLTVENHLNIVTIEETMEIMDLFLKYRKKYISSANPFFKTIYTTNRGLWYWYSFRSKIPHFHVGASINEPYLDAFSSRFVYLLRSIDEIGIQYYSGVNNDTLDDTMYYFNYFITLISGIFDALALTTKDKYKLNFKGDNFPQRISLNPQAGEYFLKALKKKNQILRNHINVHVNFIKLIYELRELVIHRKMLEKRRFSVDNWEMNSINIDKSILNYFPRDDKIQQFKPITKWGIYKFNNDSIMLEPFDFTKMVLKTLINFSNDYLKLLGFSNFIEELKNENPDDKFVREIELFKEGCLDVI